MLKKTFAVLACAAAFSGIAAGSASAVPVGSTNIPVNLGSANALTGSGALTGSANALGNGLGGSQIPIVSGSAQDLGNLINCLFPSRAVVCVTGG